MVKRGNNKFKVVADRFENSRGARYQRRLKELLHKKKLSLGSHFIRLASLEQIDEQTDARLYTDEDNDVWIDRLGIITSFDPIWAEARIWVHWLESGDEQWTTEDQMEILSQIRIYGIIRR